MAWPESIGGIVPWEEALFLLYSQGKISSIILCGSRIVHDIHLGTVAHNFLDE